jgi:hypothetical protein
MMMMFRSSVISLLFVAYNIPSTVAHQLVRGSVLLGQLEDPQLLTEFQSWAGHHDKVYDSQDEALERLMIWNVFQLRYRSDSSKIPEGKCPAFPSCYDSFMLLYPECYSSRLWNGIELIRDVMNRLLGSYGLKQGHLAKGKGNVTISREVWEYIERRLRAVIHEDSSQKLHTQRTKKIKLAHIGW